MFSGSHPNVSVHQHNHNVVANVDLHLMCCAQFFVTFCLLMHSGPTPQSHMWMDGWMDGFLKRFPCGLGKWIANTTPCQQRKIYAMLVYKVKYLHTRFSTFLGKNIWPWANLQSFEQSKLSILLYIFCH